MINATLDKGLNKARHRLKASATFDGSFVGPEGTIKGRSTKDQNARVIGAEMDQEGTVAEGTAANGIHNMKELYISPNIVSKTNRGFLIPLWYG